jgi:hypothetical protein
MMVASQQGWTYHNAPVASCYAIAALFALGLGYIRVVLMSICLAYLFDISSRAEERSMHEAIPEEYANRSSHIYAEATRQELESMQNEE